MGLEGAPAGLAWKPNDAGSEAEICCQIWNMTLLGPLSGDFSENKASACCSAVSGEVLEGERLRQHGTEGKEGCGEKKCCVVERDPRVVRFMFCVFPAGSLMASPPKAITCPQAARNEGLLKVLCHKLQQGPGTVRATAFPLLFLFLTTRLNWFFRAQI